MAIFTPDEMVGRLARARALMSEAGLDAVLATSYPAFYYLSGAPVHPFGRPMVALVPVKGHLGLITSVIEKGHVELQTWIGDRRYYWDYNVGPLLDRPQPPLASLLHHLRAMLVQRGLTHARIGYEDATLPVRHLEAAREAAPEVTFLSASHLLDSLRLVKSEEELTIIRAADRVSDLGQQTLIDQLRPGRTAAEIHGAAREAMVGEITRSHADVAYAVRVAVGLGSPSKSAGHSEWTTWGSGDVVRAGTVLETGVDAIFWGYTGNVERAVVVGDPSERVRRDYAVMVEANERAIEAARPGVRLADIDRICKDVFAQYGCTTRTGSGVGRGIISYEGNHRELLMDVRPYSNVVLEPGMAFSLEPDLQTPDGVYRHCNTIIVTDDGCEVDSRIDRGFIQV